MKKINGLSLLVLLLGFGVLHQSCKPKKVLVNESVEVNREPVQPVQETPPPAVVEEKTEPTPAREEAPNYNFRNIQFELDSYVLKTDSYAVLDQIYREMRKDPNVRFHINGHASVEGSAEYNQKLSVDRANAVKIYLVNSGVNANNLITVGYGATQPVASNETESGRSLNRRVEIKVIR